ncbi:MAG: aromatic amino acid ammonia-lyase [Bacteroidales bacterium]|nr:aromatic amino acid ammonia-lyase [Bacteroidales bacterium]
MSILIDKLDLETCSAILFNNQQIELSEEALRRVQENYVFLQEFSKDKLIYGITTGFGPMAQYRIDEELRIQLQYNFVRSHATGTGNVLSPLYARAVMLARLSTILRGFSGIHPEVPQMLVAFLNKGIIPQIFEHGSVGASGDLVQLDHLTLNMIGEGEVFYKGEKMPAAEAMRLTGLTPIKMHIREALSLANGTSCMTGIAIVNLLYAKKLLHHCIRASVLINEIVSSFDDYFSEELNAVKLHRGQQEVAAEMRKIAAESHCFHKREDYFYDKVITERFLKTKVQEYYSLRCVPQVLGPVWDTIDFCEKIVVDELNSVSDNPIIDSIHQNVLHGGNFHGDYISIEMDKLKIAITKLTMLMERQCNYLCHDRINNILPPFVNIGQLGFNYGVQALHFTATSTTAESQTLSNPVSVHSIPCNNDNQDVVSMGTNSALMARTVVENAYQVTAVHYMTLVQAVDCLKIADQLSPITRKIYDDIREFFPVFVEDHPLYPDLQNVIDYLKK